MQKAGLNWPNCNRTANIPHGNSAKCSIVRFSDYPSSEILGQEAASNLSKMLKDLCVATDDAEHVDDAEVFKFKPVRLLTPECGEGRRQ